MAGFGIADSPSGLDIFLGDPLASHLQAITATPTQWELHRMNAALKELGAPQNDFPSVLIGGTNGKGSVAAMVESVLRSAGLKTGLYTSPHIVSFIERIQVNGRLATADDLQASIDELESVIRSHRLSFFEATTLLAFVQFSRSAVDIGVIEVGLGGRLDATNTLDPLVTAITNIDLDHEDFLGSDLRTIAREKAGILREGVPIVAGPMHSEALEVIVASAEGLSAPWTSVDARGSFHGSYQDVNAAQAIAIVQALPPRLRPPAEAVERGLRSVRWPGRLQVQQIEGVTWLFDVAHNPAGVGGLVSYLRSEELPRPFVGIIGIQNDKDWRTMLRMLSSDLDRIILTTPSSIAPERRWRTEEVARSLASVSLAPEVTPEVAADFDGAMRIAVDTAVGGTVVVTGSCHTVGAAMRHLDIDPFPQESV